MQCTIKHGAVVPTWDLRTYAPTLVQYPAPTVRICETALVPDTIWHAGDSPTLVDSTTRQRRSTTIAST